MIQIDWKLLIAAVTLLMALSGFIAKAIADTRSNRLPLTGCLDWRTDTRRDIDRLFDKYRDLDRSVIEMKAQTGEHRQNLERRLADLEKWLGQMDSKLDALLLQRKNP